MDKLLEKSETLNSGLVGFLNFDLLMKISVNQIIECAYTNKNKEV